MIRIKRECDKLTISVHLLSTEKYIERRKPQEVLKIKRGNIEISENEDNKYKYSKTKKLRIDESSWPRELHLSLSQNRT